MSSGSSLIESLSLVEIAFGATRVSEVERLGKGKAGACQGWWSTEAVEPRPNHGIIASRVYNSIHVKALLSNFIQERYSNYTMQCQRFNSTINTKAPINLLPKVANNASSMQRTAKLRKQSSRLYSRENNLCAVLMSLLVFIQNPDPFALPSFL